MKRVHYIDNYLIDPQHPVTVNLIGAGGTGSQVLTCLARLDVTLRALGHPGLSVTLYDPDIVSGTNIGRQLFSDSDIGLNKAKCLITRVNNFFGNDWKAEPRPYPSVLKEVKRDEIANITVTCTDNIKSRLDLWNVLGKMPPASYTDNATPLYWMDFGNTQTTGQVIMGTVLKKIRQPASTLYEAVGSLKVITRFVKYARVKEEDSGPSCSLAEALEKQDLFINSTLAQLGCNILWKMFRNGMIEHHGVYLNLTACYATGNVTIEIDPRQNISGGGLVGFNDGISLLACYATGNVTSTGSSTGYMHIGGFLGNNYTTVTACYWKNNHEQGIGYNKEGIAPEATNVDGTSVTWQNAVDAMNTALQNKGSEWRYELNGALPTLRKQ